MKQLKIVGSSRGGGGEVRLSLWFRQGWFFAIAKYGTCREESSWSAGVKHNN